MLTPFFIRDIFDDVFGSAAGNHTSSGMLSTDIKESESGYELIVDVPGVKRENLSAELKDGYLVISAAIGQHNNEESKAEGKYIRRERFVGSYRRSFYVGEKITQEDIKGRFEDGVLHMFVPKVTAQPQIEQRKLISIEG